MVALAVWAAGVGVFLVLASRHPGGLVGQLQAWLAFVASSPAGLAFLAGLYLARPLLLLPVTVLTAFCGYLLGPWWGLALAHGAGLLSASVGYAVARLWRGRSGRLPSAWLTRLRARTFEAVLVSRLTFVPGDLVNGAAGALALPFGPFVSATLAGGLPGTTVAVLAGAGMAGGFDATRVHLRPGFVVASVGLALASVALAALLRRRGHGGLLGGTPDRAPVADAAGDGVDDGAGERRTG